MKFIEILTKLMEIDMLLLKPDEVKKQTEALLGVIKTSQDLDAIGFKEVEELIYQIVYPTNLSLEQTVLPYARVAYLFEKNGIAEEHAHKLASLFENKNKNDIFDYLIAFSQVNPQADLMHDACGFNLPQGRPKDIEKWKTLATTQPKRGVYPLLNPNFTKLLGLSKDIVAFVYQEAEKNTVKSIQDKLITEIKNQQGVFKSTSVFQITGKDTGAVLGKEIITLPADILTEKNNTNIIHVGLAYLDRIIASYTKLCNQYEANKKTLGTLIGEENYVHALAKRQELRAKRCQFYFGLTFKQLGIEKLFDYYEAYLQQHPDPIRSYFTQMGISGQNYKRFLKLNRNKGGIYIPDVLVDGKTVGHPGYYLKKLTVKNDNEAAIAATLGKLTGCCQSLSGELGESCVIHSLTSPYGGCYAIFKGDFEQAKQGLSQQSVKELSEKFQGGIWVWRSVNDALIFDSIEMLLDDDRATELTEIGVALARLAAKELVENEKNQIETVNCGADSGISKEVGIGLSLKLEQFRDYTGYSDAEDEQLIIRNKRRPFYLLGTDKEGSEEAIQWITDTLRTNDPLKCLLEAINCSVLHKTDLCRTIMKLVEQNAPSYLSGVQILIDMLVEYTTKGLTPAILAYIEKNVFFLGAINKQIRTPLIEAIVTKNAKVALVILRAMTKLDEKDQDEKTALICAIAYNQKEVALALIQAKVKLDERDNDGKTALIYAAQSGTTEVVLALIQAKVKLEERDNDGKTALMYAGAEVIQVLIEAKVKLDTKDNNGQTALMYAAQYGTPEDVQALIEAKVKLDTEDNNGKTALMYAAQYGTTGAEYATEVVQALIEAKVKLNTKDNNRQTALMYAAQYGTSEVFLALIQGGANLDEVDNAGKTAWMHVVKRGNKMMISAIEKRFEAIALDRVSAIQMRIQAQLMFLSGSKAGVCERDQSKGLKRPQRFTPGSKL